MDSVIYLVTGAAGFLGNNVSRSLKAQGKNVRALVLEGDPAAKNIPDDVEAVTGDLLDVESLETFFTIPKGYEVIVLHIASIVTVVPDFNQKVYDVNVTGTRNIIDMCLKHKVKKLVYVSSTGAIPELPKGQKIKEPATLNPDRVLGCYSKTKAEATLMVLDTVHNQGLDASIIYPSSICGPNDFAFTFVPSFIINYANGKMPAGVAGSFNAVDVRDLADSVISCAKYGRKGEGYIVSNCFVTIRELFQLINKYANCREVKFILPVPMAKFFAFISETIARLRKKSTLFTTYSIYNLARNNDFDCSKAMRELNFKCRPFEETIKDTVLWLKAEGKIY
ncbi:MAG: NAD-dependent epimerase/dehydratase family protein [Prevotellaceae bacterium]|jgi:dihydroflavonol-4-reductase|nr:NAD-dependent epimerase/dehydratase family protein [Prevotellaceae bacterium]